MNFWNSTTPNISVDFCTFAWEMSLSYDDVDSWWF